MVAQIEGRLDSNRAEAVAFPFAPEVKDKNIRFDTVLTLKGRMDPLSMVMVLVYPSSVAHTDAMGE